MAVVLEGIKEIEKTLKDVSPREGKNIARRATVAVARKVRDAARQRAPVGETGNLRRAIKSRRAKGKRDRAEAEVWVAQSGGRTGSGFHWHFVEFGTASRKTKAGVNVGAAPAQPFIVPTIEEFRPKVPILYEREWWPQYKKEMEKRGRKQRSKQK